MHRIAFKTGNKFSGSRYSLVKDTDFMDEKMFLSLFSDADEIAKMLFSTIKTTRINKTN